MAEKITARSVDYSQWYIDIILKAKLADYSPVKGSMVIRPRGYAIWERLRDELDRRFKATGHQNAYFPLFIPMSFLKKEAEHVEGFSPELAVVTHAGGEELEEPLVVRPTSETIIWAKYRDWIQSYRDLPLLYNQWANVVRWEKRTRLFLRTSEFLWQEGHTAHETKAEAVAETEQMLEVYRHFAEEILCLPVIAGKKSEAEKFAGAVDTYSIEAMMQDKKALQAGTSHFLGQNFAKAFDVQYQTREGGLEYVWATSWGVSTRLVGAIIMTHSDDKGLVVPPLLAQDEIVIVPIFKNETKADVLAYTAKLEAALKADGRRVVLDADENNSPGWKFAEWEMRGVPLRVEAGPKDMAAGSVVLVRRDTGTKLVVKAEELPTMVASQLAAMQKEMLEKARAFRDANTRDVADRAAMLAFFGKEGAGIDTATGGFARGLWCGGRDCEAKLKAEIKVTIRNMPHDMQDNIAGGCCLCGAPAKHRAIFARSY
ncbi:MAG: proline--tRNA ligase [Spirochaetes bacterium GWD1_61_31]|nr:MAG: proline--tRNA ligase [Spirochaetes bacterium GWB1_60_80]OHD41439.1 MAG: proline--tRNA ligase [Spirochaetes bacterium GWE1_60_18]OHD43694.1 MAG: proline--tRNA ligase [Spirochaetes bacterium GWD1_61_31]OHD61341.1 MAG: proline--tRNA ligase [Spirochaetes bacterium GWF1_60_12]HAP43339.1 proline--tRNA ligase [Spirochaetaceae bacterium]